MASDVRATIEGTDLVIRVPLETKPAPSNSGKTILIASSHGNAETNLEVDGVKLTVGVNAYIKKKK